MSSETERDTERDAVKGMMELLNTGMQFQPDIAITFKQISAIYKCGCMEMFNVSQILKIEV